MQVESPTVSLDPRPTSKRDVRVAVICALGSEGKSVGSIFDVAWKRKDLPTIEWGNDMKLGRMGHHFVVQFWMGEMGKGAAGVAAERIRNSFPDIEILLIVGVCGAVPHYEYGKIEKKVRIGDVIISKGLVPYDAGKKMGTKWYPRVSFVEPSSSRFGGFLQRLEHDEDDNRELKQTSLKLLQEEVQKRQLNWDETVMPDVHFGYIASGDQVIKKARRRNRIVEASKQKPIGFEMEAAGVISLYADRVFVIKGVSDYADENKDKTSQEYAGLASAVFMRAFLDEWRPEGLQSPAQPQPSPSPQTPEQLQPSLAPKNPAQLQTSPSPEIPSPAPKIPEQLQHSFSLESSDSNVKLGANDENERRNFQETKDDAKIIPTPIEGPLERDNSSSGSDSDFDSGSESESDSEDSNIVQSSKKPAHPTPVAAVHRKQVHVPKASNSTSELSPPTAQPDNASPAGSVAIKNNSTIRPSPQPIQAAHAGLVRRKEVPVQSNPALESSPQSVPTTPTGLLSGETLSIQHATHLENTEERGSGGPVVHLDATTPEMPISQQAATHQAPSPTGSIASNCVKSPHATPELTSANLPSFSDLKKEGTKTNETELKFPDTDLLFAACKDRAVAKVQDLLKNGQCDVSKTDGRGKGMLHWTIGTDKVDDDTPLMRKIAEIMILLCKAKADFNLQDKHGHAPIHYCARSNNPHAILVLLKCNAKINILDNDDCTALNYLVKDRLPNVRFVEWFINKGAKAGIATLTTQREPNERQCQVFDAVLGAGKVA